MEAKIVAEAIRDAQRQVKLWGKSVDKRLLSKMVKVGLECFDGSNDNANGAAFETGYKEGLGIMICRRSENEYITHVFAYPQGSDGCLFCSAHKACLDAVQRYDTPRSFYRRILAATEDGEDVNLAIAAVMESGFVPLPELARVVGKMHASVTTIWMRNQKRAQIFLKRIGAVGRMA